MSRLEHLGASVVEGAPDRIVRICSIALLV